MKNNLNKVDFQTWESWNMPYYTNVIQRLPDRNLENYHFKKKRTSNTLWLIIVGLCITLVVLHWEKIAYYVKRITSIKRKVFIFLFQPNPN